MSPHSTLGPLHRARPEEEDADHEDERRDKEAGVEHAKAHLGVCTVNRSVGVKLGRRAHDRQTVRPLGYRVVYREYTRVVSREYSIQRV